MDHFVMHLAGAVSQQPQGRHQFRFVGIFLLCRCATPYSLAHWTVHTQKWLANYWWRHHMETLSESLALCAGIHWSPVNSVRALMFSLIWAWTNGCVNNRDAIVLILTSLWCLFLWPFVRFWWSILYLESPGSLVSKFELLAQVVQSFSSVSVQTFSIGISGYILVVDKRLSFNDTIKINSYTVHHFHQK